MENPKENRKTMVFKHFQCVLGSPRDKLNQQITLEKESKLKTTNRLYWNCSGLEMSQSFLAASCSSFQDDL